MYRQLLKTFNKKANFRVICSYVAITLKTPHKTPTVYVYMDIYTHKYVCDSVFISACNNIRNSVE